MISRRFKYPKNNSFFLLGPRGTGKSHFVRHQFPQALLIDLLDDHVFQRLLAEPSRLKGLIPEGFKDWVVIDEIQKIPALLDQVHHLIETRRLKFVLTGSSARKLRRSGANLLAGRAYSQHSFPLTAMELGADFDLKRALKVGLLPKAYLEEDAKGFLASYCRTYLKEEVEQERLTRNIGSFARFLESASFSQGQTLNYSSIAADCAVERKTVTNFFQILDDTLVAKHIDVFSKRSKRDLVKVQKFYFFDVGVFRQIRPMGPLDSTSELMGACCETLVFQELSARNEYQGWDYNIHFWRTRRHEEVDFVLYGERGLKAIEVKSSDRLRETDFHGLLEFKKDYPQADLFLLYAGSARKQYGDISIVPLDDFLKNADQFV